MRILPDGTQALEDRRAVSDILAAVLNRVVPQLLDGDGDARGIDVPSEALTYPGLFAAAYDAQVACRSGRPSADERRRLAGALGGAVGRAFESERRAAGSACAGWQLDLAPPEEHLRQSLARAVAQVPHRPDRADALAALEIAAWSDADRSAVTAASGLLDEVWPAIFAELGVVVVQVALLDGFGIDGFTDVTTHGAVYVNRARLGAGNSQLPGRVRLAEALVHEGAHNRCNAAALAEPFLIGASSDSEPLVATPLRQDPRPLSGLLQQLVVLVRSLLLYDRLAESSGADGVAVAAATRREKLRRQAGEALRVISGHTGRLTDHGRGVVAEAEDLLARRDAVGELAAS